MQLDRAGDVVMLSPALRALKQALPNAKITLLTSAAGSQVAPLLPCVNSVMVDQAVMSESGRNRSLDPRGDVAFIEKLRRQNFSMVVIFTSFSQSALPAAQLCQLAGIPYRIGFAREHRTSVLTHYLPPPEADMHQIDRNLHLLKAIGIPAAGSRMELHIPEETERKAGNLLRNVGVQHDTPYIALAPGANAGSKQYAPNHFASVAHILASQTDLQLVILGGAEDSESTQPVLQVAEENLYGNIHSLVGRTTVPEQAAIIRHARLVIANNSAVMQFADVFGCPMVILYSGTDFVSQWMPRNATARLMYRPAFCSSCQNTDCIHGMNCLEIRPEEVAIAALELLAERPYRQSNIPASLQPGIRTEAHPQFSIRLPQDSERRD